MTTRVQLLQAYQWRVLWNDVCDKDDLESRCLKCLITASWWSELELAKEELKTLDLACTNPLSQFAVALTLLCLGDVAGYRRVRNSSSLKLHAWMTSWLEVEFLGRSRDINKQVLLAKKLSKNKIEPPNWLLVAILNSTRHKSISLKPICKWVSKLSSDNKTTSELIQALMLQSTGQRQCESVEGFTSLKVLSGNQLENKEYLPALLSLDQLAKAGMLNVSQTISWLNIASSFPQGIAGIDKRIKVALDQLPDPFISKSLVASYQAIYLWVGNKPENILLLSEQYYRQIADLSDPRFRSSQIFFRYINRLVKNRLQQPKIYDTQESYNSLVVIGESHCLSPANLYIDWIEEKVKVQSIPLLGVKMYHLSHKDGFYYAECIKAIVENIKGKGCHILFTIGEIDTRPNEGIWDYFKKSDMSLSEIIDSTISGFVDFLSGCIREEDFSSVAIQGVSAPLYFKNSKNRISQEEEFLSMIERVNNTLKEMTIKQGWHFLDVYHATRGDDGKSNEQWHIDGYHLSPSFYLEANRWLLN